jgi:ABC-type amino acid transport substrate-binding protein/uncharacterized protein affecting Mg2+/Co2+ transport
MSGRHFLVLVVLALAAVAFLVACGRDEEPTLTTAPTSTSEAPVPEVGDVWSRIEAAGRILVGTSGDYPPFEYYTDDFVLDGFDIALVREIADRLGLEVVIKDMAFDSLGDALLLAQIDLAVAAVSVTPERAAEFDFSTIYFVTEDAILAQEGREDTVVLPRDLAGSRVAAQNQSVHQEWAEDYLVAPGFIDETDLILYREIDQSVDDLAAGLIDYVIADLPPVEQAVAEGAFSIAGQGFNRQRFALAIPKGAAVLQAQLNRVLGELQADGTIEDFAEAYLGLGKEDLIPIPTPDPNATPVPPRPPEGCIDGMGWVADLILDDQNMTNPPRLAPGQPFVKSWRVRNTGTCTWDTSYALVYTNGNTPAARMGGQPVFVDRQVKPGETYDFSVNLVASLTPGTYQGFWTMRNGQGQLFGDRVWVGITVVGSATATPLPTQTPSPNIQFTVDRTQIKQGECVTFAWNVENVQAVYFYANGQDWRQHGVGGQDERTECPSYTTTYNLRVVFRDGTTEVRQITIYVEPASVGAPVISYFSVAPEGQIPTNQCLIISWDVQGSVNTVKLARNNSDLWNPAPVKGQIQDCPPGPGSYAYTIEATGPGVTSRAQRNLTAVEPSAPPPTATPAPATPAPNPPVIQSFAVSPNQIEVGGCVQVSWRVAGDVNLIVILRDGVIVLDNAPREGSGQDCLFETGKVTYNLGASNSAGGEDTKSESVAVGPSAVQPIATPELVDTPAP